MLHIKNITLYIFGIIIVLSFGIQFFILENASILLKDSKIIESYLINVTLVGIFFLLIKLFLSKIKHNLGFLFIAFSLLKFILFFIFIKPIYKLDGTISIMEYTSFFIPYFICLLGEILILTKLLNNLKF